MDNFIYFSNVKSTFCSQVVVVHTFNPSTWEVEAGRSLCLRPAWSTERVSGLCNCTEKLCLEKQTKQNKTTTKTTIKATKMKYILDKTLPN